MGATIDDGQGVGTILDDDNTAGANDIYVWDIAFDSNTRGKGGAKHDERIVVTVRRDTDGDGLPDEQHSIPQGAAASFFSLLASTDTVALVSGSSLDSPIAAEILKESNAHAPDPSASPAPASGLIPHPRPPRSGTTPSDAFSDDTSPHDQVFAGFATNLLDPLLDELALASIPFR